MRREVIGSQTRENYDDLLRDLHGWRNSCLHDWYLIIYLSGYLKSKKWEKNKEKRVARAV